MKVAVVGGGGREHAIIDKLSQSSRCSSIVALPGNGGIAQKAECVNIAATDVAAVVAYCKGNQIDYVVVAPDDPLVLGMVDELEEAGIPAFGPNKAAAVIEGSKIFAKNLMYHYNIPTAQYESFESLNDALSYIEQLTVYPVVVKADGLALGKGVLICQNAAEAEAAVRGMMEQQLFGKSGCRLVIEEFLTGPEVSVLAFCDGEHLVPMVSSMDHKRAFDGDKGLNTGGMGVVAPNPFYTEDIAQRCMKEIFMPTVRAMQQEGRPFKGCLYFGLMLTEQGPKVIEYNCRFGDPETQVVLPLLQDDLLEIMLACTNGQLSQDMVRFSNHYAACVVMASGGYPQQYEKGKAITGIEQAEEPTNIRVYHAGTKLTKDGILVTAGGRVLGVTATASTLADALADAYNAVPGIQFENSFYRSDIGKRALEQGNA